MALLCDYFEFKPLKPARLVESKTGGYNCARATGVFQNYNVVNENRRHYPKSLWDRMLGEGSPFSQRLKERNVLGMIEHPEDGITKLDETALVVTDVHYATRKELAESADLEEGDIIGTYETLPTPKGKILEALLLANIKFGVSSRGDGTVTETGDRMTVNEDFELETWDAVFSPSVTRAIPRLMTERDQKKVQRIIKEAKENEDDEEEDKPEESMKKQIQEASFILTTGIMNNGEQLIPIQLIAESSEMAPVRWVEAKTQKQLEGLHIYGSIEEAVSDFEKFCESSGYHFNLPGIGESVTGIQTNFDKSRSVSGESNAQPKQKVTESKQTTTMDPLQEMKKVRGDISRMEREVKSAKGMKLSERADYFDIITNTRCKISELTESKPALRAESSRLEKRLTEMEEFLDEEPVEEAPGGDASATPADIEAPEDDVYGDETTDTEEVVSLLDRAADLLDELDGGEDTEVSEVSDQLRDVVAELSPSGDEFGGMDDDFEGGEVDDFGDEDMPLESIRARSMKRKIKENRANRFKRLQSEHRVLRERYKRLRESSRKLLEKFRKTSSRRGNLGEGTQKLKEHNQKLVEAARELASRYNSDTIHLGLTLFESKRPDLWETHGLKLMRAKTFEDLHEMSRALVAKNPHPADKENSDFLESRKKVSRAKLTEGSGKNGASSADSDNSAKSKGKENLEEGTHPSVVMVSRARTKNAIRG